MMKQTQSSLARRPGSARGVQSLALAAALFTLGALQSTIASADWYPTFPDRTVDGRLVDVRIKVAGRPVVVYPSPRGDARTYFEARRGRNYEIELSNQTGNRVGVLIAVDGLNVITGTRSSLSRDETMYVLDPWESTTIKGWRTSLSDVRRFVFVDEERSYAERTGQASGDLGWIRVLTFREDRPIAWRSWNQPRVREDERGADRDERAPAAPRAQAEETPAPSADGLRKARGSAQENSLRGQAEPESNPGTGWGEQKWDPVRSVEFRAAARPTDHLVLRYEYAAGLRALGIRPWRDDRERTWDRDRGELGFAQPPTR